jgi:HD-GYP domain-containing protein (c-di-GMP phosphodiesterase class II)
MRDDAERSAAQRSVAADVGSAEMMAALSLATDIAMGHPLESGLRICRIATRLGEHMDLSADLLQRTYYLSLLGHIGCTARSHEVAQVLGDDILLSSRLGTTDLSRPREAFSFMVGHVRRAFPPAARPGALARVMSDPRHFKEGAIAVCEVAGMLAARLGFDRDFGHDLDSIYEQWDGKGFPGRMRAEEVSEPARVVQVAALAVGAAAEGSGPAATADLIRGRAGRALDPAVARSFVSVAGELLEDEPSGSLWDQVIESEPAPRRSMTEDGVEASLLVMADFADLKSPFLATHSSGVASLAAAATEHLGLPEGDVGTARRAGLVHDIGRAGISSGIWDKEGPLTADEREQVRLHAYLTDRVLARPAFLHRLGAIASTHHERADGSGYFRGTSAAQQPPLARVLAAADAYHAMTEARPHRPAIDPSLAARELRADVRSGRLDVDAVEAVLEAAGQPARARREGVAGLTARELEVLRLLARGMSIKEIGRALFVAPKTADAHIQHIYAKAGVSTRAAATLFAMQHDLLS